MRANERNAALLAEYTLKPGKPFTEAFDPVMKMEQRAQKLSHFKIANGVLSFTGSERPDGSFTHFELRQTEEGRADLKLLNTPVEDHPWLLAKTQ